MIEQKGLEVGAWYDGFLWSKHKQKGTLTMQWDGAWFHAKGLASSVWDGHDGFEANMISKEPADGSR